MDGGTESVNGSGISIIFALTMRVLNIILFIFLSILAGCTKVEPTRTSGIDTIDNTHHLSTTWFYYGFSFSKAKLISTNLNPGPDISIDVNKGNVPPTLLFQANNQKPSFYKTGDFADEAAAISAYNNIKTVSVTQWQDLADPVNPNQVWIYRTGSDTYAKIRIISTVNETRQGIAYGECTFQWVYQPDGSLPFPGK